METGLKKGLGTIHVFAIASGAMISSGLFVLPGLAHAKAGPGVIWSYLLGGVLATMGALSIAELTTAMPRAGGDYFFIHRGLGPGVGTVAGLLSWFSLSLKSAFAIVGMATFIALVASIHGLVAGTLLCLVFVFLNLVGVREAARVQIALVAGLFALIVWYIVSGLPRVRSDFLIPFAPYGWEPIFSTTAFVFVSYAGLINVASMAEEVRNPGKTIPLGLFLSLTFVTLAYTLSVVVTSGVLEKEVLDRSMTPLSDGGHVILGRTGFIAMSVGAVLAFVSTANAGLMSASRYLLALSRDRLLPPSLSVVNSRFGTPHTAVFATGGMITLALFVKLDILVEAASTVLILVNILSCLTVIVLRESGLQNYRPAFRVPLYPSLQVVAILGLSFVLFELGMEAYFISAALITLGFFTYWFYGRKHVAEESALLHLVRRLTASELVGSGLEEELRQIVHERDEVKLDRFDHLVEGADVLDIREPMQRESFFAAVAARLAPRLSLPEAEVRRLMEHREEQGSTLLSEDLAVPHLVVPGTGKFDLLIIRAREGIHFSNDAPKVKAVFVLAGSRDEKHFHLRALAAIAQIAHDSEFMNRWLKAKNARGLRDLLLLSTRKRWTL